MTQKHDCTIKSLKVDALTIYCEVCIKLKEVPRSEIIILLNGCNEIEKLRKAIEIFKVQIKN